MAGGLFLFFYFYTVFICLRRTDPFFQMTIEVTPTYIIYRSPYYNTLKKLAWDEITEAFVKPVKKSLWITTEKDKIVFPVMALKPSDRKLLLEKICKHARSAKINFNEITMTTLHASRLNFQGIELAKQGLYQEAHHLFEQAIHIAPDYILPRINISNTLVHMGRYSEAERQLKIALDLNPGNKFQQDLWNNYGNLRLAQKRFSEAIDCYEKAISVFKPDPEIYFNLGLCFEQLGEWSKAMVYYERSNTISPHAKTQSGIDQVKQRMWRSCEIERLVNS